MKIDRWIRLGILSLTLAGGASSAAQFQQWRPAPQSLPPGMPAMPMPPAMPFGVNDSRFRPVPLGSFVPPPHSPMAYPGRPFVSVQGQYAPPPAFVRQYAWRPADQPADIRHSEPVANRYSRPYPMPVVPMTPPPMMPYGPFAGGMPYPPAAAGMLPPPPLPYPPTPGFVPPPYPMAPFAATPGIGPYPYAPRPYPAWGGQPYAGFQPMGYPPLPVPPPWAGTWPAVPSAAWGGVRPDYAGISRHRGPLGSLGDGFPIAGLY